MWEEGAGDEALPLSAPEARLRISEQEIVPAPSLANGAPRRASLAGRRALHARLLARRTEIEQATRAALAFFASEPDLARLCLVESRGAGPAVAARFNQAAGEMAPPLRLGRAERDSDRPLPDSTEDSVIGSLLSLAYRKAASGEAELLEDLLSECAEFVLAPYLGPSEATRLAREAT